MVNLAGAGYRYLAPTTLESLAAILVAEPSARLVAGATDLALEITQGLQSQECLVYTGRVATMKTCTEDVDGLTIGAAVTYSECKDLLCQEYPALEELLERLGSLQIRNQGTLGGNIGNASPIGDMPPVLIALGAKLQLRQGNSTRLLPVEDYFVSYKVTALQAGEFIERILVPRAQSRQLFQAYKISKRLEDDISAVCGAFNLHIADNTVHSAVIAFGGMAAIPRRATACEQALIGQPWTQPTIDAAMAALSSDYAPISDFRASAEYRQRVAMNLLQRLFLESAAASASVRVTHYA